MTDRNELLAKLTELLGKQVEITTPVTEQTDFFNDLGFDSIDAMEYVMEVEEAFDVSISDDEANDLRTVGAVLDLLQRLHTAA